MITEELKKLYTVHTGHEPETIDELPSSGSNRRYFRLTGTPTLRGAVWRRRWGAPPSLSICHSVIWRS